jgi:hypothetical protein
MSVPKNESNMPAVHPLVDKLLATENATPPKVLSGYVGRSSRDGYVLVYPSLRTLDRSYEISAADILHTESIPESIKPFGATMFWLRPDAVVGFRHVNTGSSSDSGVRQPNPSPFADERIGRLKIQSPAYLAPAMNTWQAFHCTCTECSVCMSHCDNSCSSGDIVMGA